MSTLAWKAELDGLSPNDVARTHRFEGVTTQDASRVHLGDNITTNIYHPGYSQDAQTPSSDSTREPLKHDSLVKLLDHFSDALSFLKMKERFAKVANDHADTCKWVFETPQFLEWRNPDLRSQHHGFLWIKGKPGAGKSTIMKSAVRKANEEADARHTTLSFFFEKSGNPLMRSTEGMFRSLLCQVVQEVPDLCKQVLRKDADAYREEGWQLELLKDLFSKAVRELVSVKHVVCYIDALDEGDEREVRDMVSFMADLAAGIVQKDFRFSVCLSSRNHPKISVSGSKEIVLDKHGDHKEAIAGYVEKKLTITDPRLKRKLARKIEVKAAGVFLWVVLVVRELNAESDRGNVHLLNRKLKTVPVDLESLFREILEREQDRDGRLAASIQWVLYTIVPLSCEELYSAMMISTDDAEADWTDFDTSLEDSGLYLVDPAKMEDMILSSSRGLVEISDRGESVDCVDPGLKEEMSRRLAQFIHESVKDYFLKGGLRHLDESLSHNAMAISYERLACWCYEYFSLALTGDSLACDKSVDHADWIATRCKSWPLLQYAADNMLVYASKATESGFHPRFHIAESLVHIWLLMWEKGQGKGKALCYPLRSMCTMLHVLCNEGLSGMVNTELERVANISEAERTAYLDAPCQGLSHKLGTALHIAIHAGHLEIARALMASGADLNARCDLYGTPLCTAIQNGHDDIARELLMRGADANILTGSKATALQLAIGKLNADMMRSLLQHGAEVNDERSPTGTPIFDAVRMKNEAAVRLLLTHGADVRVRNSSKSLNAVQYARRTARRMLPVFSEFGIDVDADEFSVEVH